MKIIIVLTEHVLYAWHFCKWISSLILLVSPSYRRVNRGAALLSDLLSITQIVSGRAGTRTQASSPPGTDHLGKVWRSRCCLFFGRPFCLVSPSYALVPTPTKPPCLLSPAFCRAQFGSSVCLSLKHPPGPSCRTWT